MARDKLPEHSIVKKQAHLSKISRCKDIIILLFKPPLIVLFAANRAKFPFTSFHFGSLTFILQGKERNSCKATGQKETRLQGMPQITAVATVRHLSYF
jgi:hypothetical protein